MPAGPTATAPVLDDLSEATTAQLLGVSVGTVKSQTHVALRRLREEIGLDLVDTTAGETT